MARPPISKETHRLNGTYRKDRQEGRGLDIGKIKNIPAPLSLNEEAKSWWQKIVTPFCKTGLASPADALVLQEAFEEWQTAQKYKKLSLEKEEEGDIETMLLLDKQATFHSSASLKILYKYGATPQENLKVKVAPKPEEEQDAVQALLAP